MLSTRIYTWTLMINSKQMCPFYQLMVDHQLVSIENWHFTRFYAIFSDGMYICATIVFMAYYLHLSLLGFLYDYLGSYTIAFHAAGTPPIIGACLMFFIPQPKQVRACLSAVMLCTTSVKLSNTF